MQRRASGWAYLDRTLQADVSLLQEVAAAPTDRPGIAKKIGGNRAWGSAVLSRHPLSELTDVTSRHTRRPVALIRHNAGAVVAALIHLPDEEPLVTVSLYGLIDDGYAVTSVHRARSDLAPLMDSAHATACSSAQT
jgi:hypothetical protein